MKYFAFLVLAAAISACGKNDGFRSVPGYAPIQAPAPGSYPPGYGGGYPGGGYGNPTGYPGGGYPPGGFPPGGGYPPGAGYSNPQMPPGYPNQYAPFLPIDNYMRQQQPQYWNQMWSNWIAYSQQQHYQPYDFNHFWVEFCPQQMGGMNAPIYNYYDTYYYSWVTPSMQFGQVQNPSVYWTNYSMMPTYGGCSTGCY